MPLHVTMQYPPAAIIRIDACGLQCPGPIQRLKAEMDKLKPGDTLCITATDPGFVADVPAWCNTTGNKLIEVAPERNGYRATIVKSSQLPSVADTPCSGGKRQMTIVVFSNDFDRAMAAFIIANGAAAMGYEPTLFFTFWGLNVLRKDGPVTAQKNLVERMFGWMMPKGPDKLTLSKMNMGGMGLAMLKDIMRKKNVASLPELIRSAKEAGVRLVSCAMSMDLMGIRQEEMIAGVERGGVAMYLDRASAGNVNLFV